MLGVSAMWARDAAERVGWTALEAGAGAVIVAVTPLSVWWAAPIAVALASLKAYAAKHRGDPESASMAKRGAGGS